MSLGDDVRLQAAGQPFVMPVGCERILVGLRAEITDRPHAAGARADDHGIAITFGRNTECRYSALWRSNSSSLTTAMIFTLRPAASIRGSCLTRFTVELEPCAST